MLISVGTHTHTYVYLLKMAQFANMQMGDTQVHHAGYSCMICQMSIGRQACTHLRAHTII